MSLSGARNLDLNDALDDVTGRYRAASPASAERFEAACRSMPGGNTRTVLYYSPYPITFARGERSYLWDLDRRRFIDFVCEQSAALYGHSDPAIMAAIEDALGRGFVLGGPNRYEVELADLICDRFESIEQVRFCNSGTEANLCALTTARAVTGRDRILVFEGAYHGSVLHFPKQAGSINVPFESIVATYNDADQTVALIDQESPNLAAVLVEPMMGAAGCIPARREFLGALRAACDRHGIILIFDEVMTSRLSSEGIQGLVGIRPDMTTLGKYVGGGMSFGAFGGRRDLMARFDPRRIDRFNHPGTFNNNVLTMAAGAVGLRDLFTPEVAKSLNDSGDRLRGRLNRVFERRQIAAQVTGTGSLMSTHLTRAPIHDATAAQRGDARLKELLHLELILRGIYTARRGFIALSLPLTEEDLDTLVSALEAIVEQWAPLLTE